MLGKRGFARRGEDEHEIVLLASGGCEFRSYWVFNDDSDDKEADYLDGSRSCMWEPEKAWAGVLRGSNVVGGVRVVVEWPQVRASDQPRFAVTSFAVERRDGELALVARFGEAGKAGIVDFVRRP